jgi:opacity protein-like surface antigen
MKTWLSLLICSFVIFVPNFSYAADFNKALGIMDANIPSGADTAGMGNCWAAMPGYSSSNPATIAAGEPYRFSGSVNYSATIFKNGPAIHAYDTSVYAAMPFGGVVQMTHGGARSSSAATRMDCNVQFNHQPYFDLMYGLKVKENMFLNGDKFYLGLGAGVNWSKMGFASQGQNTLISRSRGMTLKSGALYQPIENLNFGAMYSWSRGWGEDRDIENAISVRSTSDTHQVRIGASWKVLPKFGTTLAADYQHLNIGHVKRDQFFVGVEQQVVKDRLYLYGGWAHSGPTAGVGLYFKHGGVNVAYMNNPFADLNPHLGRAQTITATAFIKW